MDSEIQKEILSEAHYTPNTIHPGGTKMYKDLKAKFWWNGMKRDIDRYIA